MISDSRNSRQMRKLNEVTFIQVSGIRCIDKKKLISLNQYIYNLSSLLTVWLQISQLLQKVADQDLHFCHAFYVLLYSLVDNRVTCFHLQKYHVSTCSRKLLAFNLGQIFFY